jgi:hypothetical protein
MGLASPLAWEKEKVRACSWEEQETALGLELAARWASVMETELVVLLASELGVPSWEMAKATESA